MCSNCKVSFQSSSEFKLDQYEGKDDYLFSFQSSSEFKRHTPVPKQVDVLTFNPLLSLSIIKEINEQISSTNFQSSSEFKSGSVVAGNGIIFSTFQSSSEFKKRLRCLR